MRVLLASLALLPAFSGGAQTITPRPAAGSNWQHVLSLPPGTSLRIAAKAKHTGCRFKAADAESLTCTRGKDLVFQRTDIRSITIPRRGRSTLVMAGIGAGVGAIVGAASGSSCTPAQKDSFLGCFVVFTRGELATIGGALGGVLGAPIGLATDVARSSVYQAP